MNGNLSVGRDTLKAIVRDTSRAYGSPNPAFSISYTGFINGDDASKIVAPAASTIATAPLRQHIPDYTIRRISNELYYYQQQCCAYGYESKSYCTANNQTRIYGDQIRCLRCV